MSTAVQVPEPIHLPTFSCNRCGHSWHPAKPVKPGRCAGCKSPYWERARVYKLRKRGRKPATPRAQRAHAKTAKS